MDVINRRTTLVGIVTLIVGIALGLGIGVWSVKKSHASNVPAASSSSSAVTNEQQDSNHAHTAQWDPFREMEKMQQEINRAIRRATEQFELAPDAKLFRPDLGYSSSFDLRDRKDHFELRAYLPDAEASDVNVKIDNGNTLHVSVAQRKQETKRANGSEASVTELGRYEQVITLPEPVRSSDMKVERNGHEIVITIPKAKSA